MRNIVWKPEERENDFVGYDGAEYIGRAYLTGTIHTGQQWKWFFARGGSGSAESRLAAMMKLEELWAEWLAIKLFRKDYPPTDWLAVDECVRNHYRELSTSPAGS